MTPYLFIAAAFFVAFAAGVAAFLRPRRVIQCSFIAAACALVARPSSSPIWRRLSWAMAPAWVLLSYFMPARALVLLIAIAAVIGVATRHVWTVLRGA